MKYFFIEPTTKIKTFFQFLLSPEPKDPLEQLLKQQYPDASICLTDSGRSALAVIFETLKLQGKIVALPAYICDVLAPVLQQYQIQPVFLDIDPKTYVPPLKEYHKKITQEVDAILVCHTYGNTPSDDLQEYFQQSQKIIIEDLAHCQNFIKADTKSQLIKADAQYLSFSKIFPVAEEGMAIFPEKNISFPTYKMSPYTFSFLKRWVQTFSVGRKILWQLKTLLQTENKGNESFSQIFSPKISTKKYISFFLKQKNTESRFCIPIRSTDRKNLQQKLLFSGVIAQTLWSNPILFHPLFQKNANHQKTEYPNTTLVSKQILCLPNLTPKHLKQLSKDLGTHLG